MNEEERGNIPVRNIYYMLAYVLPELRSREFDGLGSEAFANAAELCAEILIRAVSTLVKRGLGRDYVSRSESLPLVKGRVQVVPTLRSRLRGKVGVECLFDEYSVDTPFNQTVKATLQVILRLGVCEQRQLAAKRLLAQFNAVSDVPVSALSRDIRLQRQHSFYGFVLYMCWLVIDGLLTTEEGNTRGVTYFSKQKMYELYERFLRAYFQREYPQFFVAAKQVQWAQPAGCLPASLLPRMTSDVYICYENQILIIDAKWYTDVLSSRMDGSPKLKSSHLYQISTYVTHEAATRERDSQRSGQEAPQVAGLLLYAQDAQRTSISERYILAGNRIGAETVDMGADFEDIRATLDGIIAEYFPHFAH